MLNSPSLVCRVVRTALDWTGGQYSAWRIVLAAIVAVHAFSLAPAGHPFLALAALLAAASLLAGHRDRGGAVLGAAAIALGPRPDASISGLALVAALGLHAAAPPAPFGSWAALGRVDPGGGWGLPGGLRTASWCALAAAWFLKGLGDLPSSAAPLAVLELAAPFLFLIPQVRPLAWTTLLGVLLGSLATGDGAGGLLALHLLAFAPDWIRPVDDGAPRDVVFYDGNCALCHGVVRFLLAEDPGGAALGFAPLGGERFRTLTPAMRIDVPDAVAVAPRGEEPLLWRSEAVLRLLARLGGAWRVAAAVGGVLPPGLRDALYDAVAARRKRIFGEKSDACPLLPERLRSRIDFDRAAE